MGTIYFKCEFVNKKPYEKFEYKGDGNYSIPISEIVKKHFGTNELISHINNEFIWQIECLPDTGIENCLNFHYNEFKGSKHLFLIHTKALTKHKDFEKLTTKKQIVLNWIEEKTRQPNEPKQLSKHKEPKRTSNYTTVFNKKETSLFAYFLREKKIILEHTSSILLADCFGKLTGFSDIQINKDLKSIENCFDISENTDHYEKILSELKKLIEYIESEIKTNRPDLNINV